MKNITKLATAVVVASGLAAPAYADLMAMSTAHVYMNVAPHVSVGGGSGSGSGGGNPGGGGGTCAGYAGSTDGICWDQNIFLGDFQVGPVPASIDFFVEANLQEIELACGATDLYKGNIAIDPTPTDPHDDPIPLNLAAGCKITMSGATPAGGASNVGDLNAELDSLVGDQATWTVYKTNGINFHANVPEPSRNVNLMLEWDHNNPEQRIGQYSGFVKMYVFIPGVDF